MESNNGLEKLYLLTLKMVNIVYQNQTSNKIDLTKSHQRHLMTSVVSY